MTSKVKGTEGIEFPDSTVQGSAAYTKAQADALLLAKANDAAPIYIGTANGTQVFPFNVQTKVDLLTPTTIRGMTFDAVTDRITPTVAGWYNAHFWAGPGAEFMSSFQLLIRKNGTTIAGTNLNAGGANYMTDTAIGLVSMNGTTDYLEMFFVSLPTDGQSMNFVDGGIRVQINRVAGL